MSGLIAYFFVKGGSIEGLLLKRVTQDADEVNRKYYVTVDEPQKAFNKLTDKSYEGYLPPGKYKCLCIFDDMPLGRLASYL